MGRTKGCKVAREKMTEQEKYQILKDSRIKLIDEKNPKDIFDKTPEETTTIRLKVSTKERLDDLPDIGKKTYDEILTILTDAYVQGKNK